MGIKFILVPRASYLRFVTQHRPDEYEHMKQSRGTMDRVVT